MYGHPNLVNQHAAVLASKQRSICHSHKDTAMPSFLIEHFGAMSSLAVSSSFLYGLMKFYFWPLVLGAPVGFAMGIICTLW